MSELLVDAPICCPLHFGPLNIAASDAIARAVFLDRDGVLIEDTGYPDDPDAISLLPGVGEALRRLAAAGWRLVVVTNQSGVARERFSLQRLDAIHARLVELLEAEGVRLNALFYCPHHPRGSAARFAADCDHRKPAPGMLLDAARELRLSLQECWMVGDKESDIRAGHSAGCRAVRVGDAGAAIGSTEAEAVVEDLRAAVEVIMAQSPLAGSVP